MPISEYFKGNGSEVMANMQHEYGDKKGKSIFYATANKNHAKPMATGGAIVPWWEQQQPMPPMPGTEMDPSQLTAPPPMSRFDMPPQPQEAGMPDQPQEGPPELPQRVASAAPPEMPGSAPITPPQQEASSEADMGNPGALSRGAASATPAPPTPSEDPRITAEKDLAARLATKSKEHVPAWRQALGAALTLSPRTQGISQMVLNPPDKAMELAAEIRKEADQARLEEKAKQDAEIHRLSAESLATQRESLAEQRKQNAESFAMGKATAAKTEERKKIEDALRFRTMGVVQDATTPVPAGFSAVALPDEPGKVVVIPPTKTHFVVNKATIEMAESLGMSGLREGDVISTDVWKVLATAAGRVAGVQAKPEPPAKPQYTGVLRAAIAAEGGDADDPNLDPGLLKRAIERSKERPPGPGNETARSDKSYQFNVGELNKMGKPVADTVQRLGRLQDTLAQNNPQADALVAPELLTVMAGGAGSGLRMNEAEIARIVGGRSKWESLKAAINQWQIDPAAARSITPAQQQQIRALVQTVATKLNAKQAAIDEAHQTLLGSDDPAEHRKAVNEARKKFTSVDTQGNPAPQGAQGGAYQHYAVGAGGHRIGSNDGKTWFDIESGSQIK